MQDTLDPKASTSGFYDFAIARKFFEAGGRREAIPAGTVLFRENEKSNKQGLFQKPLVEALTTPVNGALFAPLNIHRMYLLEDGEVSLTAGNKKLETITAGDVFGELAVLSEIPDQKVLATRSATATALAECHGWSMDGKETEAALAKHPEFALMLLSVMFERLRQSATRLMNQRDVSGHRSLKSEPLFDAATLEALEARLERATVVRFQEDAKIMIEGRPGTTMYIVKEGKVAVAIGRRIVEKIGPGGVFGEMALVDQRPRLATAIAKSECALLSINREALIGLVKGDPAIGMALMRAVAARVRYMNELLS